MKEKSFAQELAALINRHGIDAKMNTNDWILADVAIDALNAYGKANQLREKMANAPEPGKDDCDCPACTLRRTLQGKARPGMFGNKGNERGNGIHQPPWNATLFSLLKWEIRKRYRIIGNKPRKTKPGFCRLYT